MLPTSTAEHMLSGKYAEVKDPRAALVAMTGNLETRATAKKYGEVGKTMAEAGRSGDRDRARLLAQLAVAERKGDHELAARIKHSLASESQGKQVD